MNNTNLVFGLIQTGLLLWILTELRDIRKDLGKLGKERTNQ